MKKLTFILSFAVLTVINGCSKENSKILDDTVKGDRCGTVLDLTWTQNLTIDSLVGNWKILGITYSKGNGQSNFDTTYNASATLRLNNDGTGLLNNIPINWNLIVSPNIFPVLTFTSFETLFPFPVNFIQNNRLESNLERMPNTNVDSKIYITVEKTISGQWEQAFINFVRQK